MSIVIYVAPGVDSVEFHKIFIVSTSAVDVPVSTRPTNLSSPIVSLVLFFFKSVWLVRHNDPTIGYLILSVVRDIGLVD